MSYQQYQCDPEYVADEDRYKQDRGVTTWNLTDQHQIGALAPGSIATLTFTCTTPKCYSYSNGNTGTYPTYGRDSCNIVYNAWPQNSTIGSNHLAFSLNGYAISGCYLSTVATHGGTQCFDLANIACYNDAGINTLTICNDGSNNSTIQIDHFKIYRTYKMCNLRADSGGSCLFSSGGTLYCHCGETPGTMGNLDSLRVDTPCNYETCGGLSFIQIHDDSKYLSEIDNGSSLACLDL